MLRKKIAVAIVACAASLLLAGGMANAESGFPSDGEASTGLPALETYADRHANEPAATGMAAESCFPSEASECGPDTLGMENMPEAVGATEGEAAGGEVLPEQAYPLSPSGFPEWVTDD